MTQADIYKKVVNALVEELNVDEEEVQSTSTLQGDLGAESIDLIGIVFRLERDFSVRIRRGELFPESMFYGDPEMVQDGKVTDKGMAEIRASIPDADLGEFEKHRDRARMSELFTVGMIVRHIQSKLKQQHSH